MALVEGGGGRRCAGLGGERGPWAVLPQVTGGVPQACGDGCRCVCCQHGWRMFAYKRLDPTSYGSFVMTDLQVGRGPHQG